MVDLAFLGFFLFLIIGGIIFGLIRGLRRATLRLITVVIAGVVAIFATPLFVGLVPADAMYMIEEMLYGIPVSAAFVTGLITVLFNLIVFIGVFLIFSAIAWIVYAIVGRNAYTDSKGRPRKRRRLLGALVGVVQSLVIFALLMIPFYGTFNMVNGAVGVFNEQTQGEENFRLAEFLRENESAFGDFDISRIIEILEMVDEQVDIENINRGFPQMVLRYTGLEWLIVNNGFNHLTNRQITPDQTFRLTDEVNSLAEVLGSIVSGIEQLFALIPPGGTFADLDLTVGTALDIFGIILDVAAGNAMIADAVMELVVPMFEEMATQMGVGIDFSGVDNNQQFLAAFAPALDIVVNLGNLDFSGATDMEDLLTELGQNSEKFVVGLADTGLVVNLGATITSDLETILTGETGAVADALRALFGLSA